jgi:hypothetical protein
MRRKKTEVDVTKQTLAAEEQGITLTPKHGGAEPTHFDDTSRHTDGVIDLDPVQRTQFIAETLTDKPKRKYTKRAKKVVVTPTFIDGEAILSARIQEFTNYALGKVTFEDFSKRDDKFRQLAELAAEINK